MINIDFKENLDDEICDLIDNEFNKFAEKNGVICDYTPFGFIAKDGNKIVGVIKGHSLYKEVRIGELIVLEEYHKKISEPNLSMPPKNIAVKTDLKI